MEGFNEVEAKTATIKYSTGIPPGPGVYACRVPSIVTGWMEDIFLIYIKGEWGYLGSDCNYRGDIKYWLGPLDRIHE